MESSLTSFLLLYPVSSSPRNHAGSTILLYLLPRSIAEYHLHLDYFDSLLKHLPTSIIVATQSILHSGASDPCKMRPILNPLPKIL